jgi:hypothetical protein
MQNKYPSMSIDPDNLIMNRLLFFLFAPTII